MITAVSNSNQNLSFNANSTKMVKKVVENGVNVTEKLAPKGLTPNSSIRYDYGRGPCPPGGFDTTKDSIVNTTGLFKFLSMFIKG